MRIRNNSPAADLYRELKSVRVMVPSKVTAWANEYAHLNAPTWHDVWTPCCAAITRLLYANRNKRSS